MAMMGTFDECSLFAVLQAVLVAFDGILQLLDLLLVEFLLGDLLFIDVAQLLELLVHDVWSHTIIDEYR